MDSGRPKPRRSDPESLGQEELFGVGVGTCDLGPKVSQSKPGKMFFFFFFLPWIFRQTIFIPGFERDSGRPKCAQFRHLLSPCWGGQVQKSDPSGQLEIVFLCGSATGVPGNPSSGCILIEGSSKLRARASNIWRQPLSNLSEGPQRVRIPDPRIREALGHLGHGNIQRTGSEWRHDMLH